MSNAPDTCAQLIIDTARGGETPFAIFGDSHDYQLVSLRDDVPVEVLRQSLPAGFVYAGVLGIVEGRPKVALGPDAGSVEIETVRQAGVAFARLRLGRDEQFGDSTEWLERLYSLPDTNPKSGRGGLCAT